MDRQSLSTLLPTPHDSRAVAGVPDASGFSVSVNGMCVFTGLMAFTAFAGWTLAAGPKGTYKGTWSSACEGSGNLTISFSGADSDALKADVSFSLEARLQSASSSP
jgi:hypothetical protein